MLHDRDTRQIDRQKKLDALLSLMDFLEIKVRHDKSVVLHFKDGIRLTSDKDVIIMCGHERDGKAQKNPDRPGYVYGVWENPPLNFDGDPQMKLPFMNVVTGEIVNLEAWFTPAGKLIVPFGYMAEPHYGEPCKDC